MSQKVAHSLAHNHDALSHTLTTRFAKKCFTPLELHSLKQNFHLLASSSSSLLHWREETLTQFLEIPDAVGAGPVIYQSATYLGAFPFPSLAPSVLDWDALIKVLVIMTQREGKVLKGRGGGKEGRAGLLFRSLAVFDREKEKEQMEQEKLKDAESKSEHGEGKERDKLSDETAAEFQRELKEAARGVPGFAIDEPANDANDGEADENDDDEDDDELALAALGSLDAIEVYTHDDSHTKSKSSTRKTNPHHAHSIPVDNFRSLVMLMLLTASLEAQESLSVHAQAFLVNDGIRALRRTADDVVSAFLSEEDKDAANSVGVRYHNFMKVLGDSFPTLFSGLIPLFEHFLFCKTTDLSARKPSDSNAIPATPTIPRALPPDPPLPPILPSPGEILTLPVLSHLSFFLPPGRSIFRRMQALYSGAEHGFSMGSLETKVFHWQAPTILLVSGTLLPDPPNPQDRSFIESLPPKKLPDGPKGARTDDKVLFGAYITAPWKHTHKGCFGTDETLLFALSPSHDIFRASTLNGEYISFTKPPTPFAGISLGSPVPAHKPISSHATLGPVSLHLDSSFEHGVFTHDASHGGGGSFHPSSINPGRDYQSRFTIDSLEVWGVGGEEEQKMQLERWRWEEMEAEKRRRVNVGRGDVEADRALLELAGLVGAGRSGGSMA
ncbi:MAG: Restriction of telomere capping protein 5 [Caeruleum heppii]|nr:MAG: Restriction of telomere capping protein 5 [Caeruleum heppii]